MLSSLQVYRSLDRRVWILAAGRLINTIGFSMVFPFLSIYLHTERGLPMEQVGLVLLSMGAARLTGPLVSGILTDRFGRRGMLCRGPFWKGFAFMVLAAAIHVNAGLGVLAVFLFAATFLGTFYQNACSTYLADLVAPDRRADAYGLLSIGVNIGWMMGPAVGAFLVRTPFSLLFGVAAACSFILAGINHWFLPETAPSHSRPQRKGISLGVFKEQPGFFLLCLFAFAIFLTSSQLVSTLSVFSTEIVGISRPQLGFAYTLNGLVVIVFMVPLSAVLARVRTNLRMAAGALLFAGGYLALSTSGSYTQLMGWVVVISLAEIFVFPAGNALASTFAGPDSMGRFIGVYGLVRGLGYTIGPWLGSTLYGVFGGSSLGLWGIMAGFSALGALGFLFLKNRRSHPAP